jgi:hypothetical protein
MAGIYRCKAGREASIATCQGNDSREPEFEGGAWPLCPPGRLGVSVARVPDPDTPSLRLIVEQLGKPTVRARLHEMARWRTGSDEDAKDLVADALVRVLDLDDAPWVPERIIFLYHMNDVIRQTWDRQLRKIVARREVVDPGLARDENTKDPDLAPDEQLHDLRTLHRWRQIRDEVLAEIGDKHPLARGICDLTDRGVDEPSDQAPLLHCTVDEIYRALETLQYHAMRKNDEWELSEQRRMEKLRERAMTSKNEATQ